MVCQLLIIVSELLNKLNAIVEGSSVKRMALPNLLDVNKLAFVIKVLIVIQGRQVNDAFE
jgi:hypothetical protein